MVKQRTFRVVASLLCLSLFFAFALIPASYVQAGNAEGKISRNLSEEFKKEDEVTFLVKFKEQVDTIKVAEKVEKKGTLLKQTAAQKELAKRTAVVNALQDKASETQQDVLATLDAQKKKGQVADYHSYFIVNAIAVTGTEKAAKKIAAHSEVEAIVANEEGWLISPVTGKNETDKGPRGRLFGGISATEWNVDRVGAPEVWNEGFDGSGVVVASIDTGAQWDHPALKEKYRGYKSGSVNHQYNWFDAVNGETVPYDDNGHGTHVTGTMVGANGSNQIGVAPGAKWIAVQVIDDEEAIWADVVLKAAEWVLAPKDENGRPNPRMAPDVVNNSWGFGPGMEEFFREAVQAWRAVEIFPVFASGNDGPEDGTVAVPANYPESFAVGATDSNNELAFFSSRGPSPYDEIKPDVVAPGVNIRSSVPGSDYGDSSGTSMAAPHVAGIAALLIHANPAVDVDDIEEALTSSATELSDDEYPGSPNNGYGHGLVNAPAAVSAVTN